MSNLMKSILQSSLLGALLIFIAYLIEGKISLPELSLSIVSVYVLFLPYRYYRLQKITVIWLRKIR